jgi:serine/threonine protein kinase/WD40 repeat protein
MQQPVSQFGCQPFLDRGEKIVAEVAPTPATTLGQFLTLLKETGVLSEADLAAVESACPAANRDGDAEAFARELVKQGKLTRHQAASLYQRKPKTIRMGDYLFTDRLGVGGSGTVYLSRRLTDGTRCAVKVLNLTAARSADALTRFKREAETSRRLNHPQIVRVLEAGESAGQHYIAMEYVDGIDLSTYVKNQGPLPLDQAVSCIVQAARALAHAHEQGVVHRDIKPANLMFGRDGKIKILDMGLARLDDPAMSGTAQAAEGLTQTGQVMGTVDYMAPEQALHTRLADARADVYSLGCTFYRLVTGNIPYDADSLVAKILAHREMPIPPLGSAKRIVPPAVQAVFARMMAKRPEDRYQTMQELADDLERSLTSGAGAPRAMPTAIALPLPPMSSSAADVASQTFNLRSTSTNTNLRKPATTTKKKSSTMVYAAVAAVLLIGGGAGFYFMSSRPAEPPVAANVPPKAVAPRPTSNTTPVGVAAPAKPAVPGAAPASTRSEPNFNVAGADPRGLFAGNATTTATSSLGPAPTGVPNFTASPSVGLITWTDNVGFEPLFNRRDLTGWHLDPKQLGNWRIENNSLVGSEPMTHLISDREFGDFHLRAEVRINDQGNSGIYFRTTPNLDHPPQDPKWPRGYEVQIMNGITGDKRKTGSVFVSPGPPLQVIDASPAPPNQWFAIEVIAVKNHFTVKVNGAVASDCYDLQSRFNRGRIALQATGPTYVEFRQIEIKDLEKPTGSPPPTLVAATTATSPTTAVLPQPAAAPTSPPKTVALVDAKPGDLTTPAPPSPPVAANPYDGEVPTAADGRKLNLDFETGTLADWTAEGEAFRNQPIEGDAIARRISARSNHAGQFWIGSFERLGDRPLGTLSSAPFRVTQPWASFLIGGGDTPYARIEFVRAGDRTVVWKGGGRRLEEMHRVLIDVRNLLGSEIFLRLFDDGVGGWGHINFDDFRLHAKQPPTLKPTDFIPVIAPAATTVATSTPATPPVQPFMAPAAAPSTPAAAVSTNSLRLTGTLLGHKAALHGVAVHQNGVGVVTSCADGDHILWNQGREVSRFRHGDRGEEGVFDRTGNVLVTASAGPFGGSISIRNLLTGDKINFGTRSGGCFWCVDLHSAGRWVVASGADRALRLWDMNLAATKALAGPAYNGPDPEMLPPAIATFQVANLAFHPRDLRLAAGGNDGAIQFFSIANNQIRPSNVVVVGHKNGRDRAIRGLRYTPDGRFVVSASRDGTVQFWDANTGQSGLTITAGGPGLPITGFDLSRDGQYIVVGLGDGNIKLFDAASGKELASAKAHEGSVNHMAFSPASSRHFASAGFDFSAKTWEIR